jgi:hypothetical protein
MSPSSRRKTELRPTTTGREELEGYYQGSSFSRAMNSKTGFIIIAALFLVLAFLMLAPPDVVGDFDFTIEYIRQALLALFGK